MHKQKIYIHSLNQRYTSMHISYEYACFSKNIKLSLQEGLSYNVESNTHNIFTSVIEEHMNNNIFRSIEDYVSQ